MRTSKDTPFAHGEAVEQARRSGSRREGGLQDVRVRQVTTRAAGLLAGCEREVPPFSTSRMRSNTLPASKRASHAQSMEPCFDRGAEACLQMVGAPLVIARAASR